MLHRQKMPQVLLVFEASHGVDPGIENQILVPQVASDLEPQPGVEDQGQSDDGGEEHSKKLRRDLYLLPSCREEEEGAGRRKHGAEERIGHRLRTLDQRRDLLALVKKDRELGILVRHV